MDVAVNRLFLLCLVSYGLATVLYVAAWTLRRRGALGVAYFGFSGVVVLHAGVAVLHTISTGRLPLGPPVGAQAAGPWDHPLSSLALLLGMGVVASGLIRPKTRVLGAFIAPVVSGLAVGSLLIGEPTNAAALLPDSLESLWVPLHTAAIYSSVALFALAFGGGILYLRQDRRLRRKQLPDVGGMHLPSLGVLDSINHWGFSGGLLGLTIGIVTGTFVAATGGAAGLDLRPKIVTTLGLWMLYALGWQARYLFGWGGRRAAWLAIIGFVGLIASAVGVGHA